MLDVPVVRDSPSVSCMRSLRVEHEKRRKKCPKHTIKLYLLSSSIFTIFLVKSLTGALNALLAKKRVCILLSNSQLDPLTKTSSHLKKAVIPVLYDISGETSTYCGSFMINRNIPHIAIPTVTYH